MFVTQEGFDDEDAKDVLLPGQRSWSAVKVPSWSANWFIATYQEIGDTSPCLGALLISSRDTLYDLLCSRTLRVSAVALSAFDRKSRGWRQYEVTGIWIAHKPLTEVLADSMVLTLRGDPTVRTTQLLPLPPSVPTGPCLYRSPRETN